MEPIYPTTTTTTVTPPYGSIATIELLRRYFCRHPIGTLIHTSVRRLGRAIGRSAGEMTDHLDQLEADGWIRRLADHTGTLVEVLRTDLRHDRSFEASGCDHVHDRPAKADHAVPAPNPPSRPAATPPETDHADDPPLHPPIRNHDSCQQQQRDSHARESGFAERRTRDPGCPDRVFPHEWRQILAANPGYTRRDFERELALAEARPDLRTTPVQLVVGVRRRGEIVYSAAELYARQEGTDHGRQSTPHSAERPAAARPNANRRRGARRHADRPGTAGGGPGGAVDYDALLAEIDAAGPVELRL